MIDSNGVVVNDICKATIRFLSPDEVKKQSVVEVNKIDIWDMFQNPVEGGLHDIRMGPVSSKPNQTCGTCGLGVDCPGHVGHIELSAPVYHPLLISHLIKLMKVICFSCKRLRISKVDADRYIWLFRLLNVENLSDMEMFEMLTGPLLKDNMDKEGDASLASQVKASRKQALKQLKKRLAAEESRLNAEHRNTVVSHLLPQDLKKLPEGSLASIPSVHPPIVAPGEPVPLEATGNTSTKVEMWAALQQQFFKDAQKTKCMHCDSKTHCSVRKSKEHTQIVVQWAPTSSSPFKDEENNDYDDTVPETTALAIPSTNTIVEGRRKINRRSLFARDVEPLMAQVFEIDRGILQMIIPAIQRTGPSIFFMQAVAVPSNRFRPLQPALSGDGRSSSISLLHPRTAALLNLLKASHDLEIIKAEERAGAAQGTIATSAMIKRTREARENQFRETLANLQYAVNSYLDKTRAQNPAECAPGIRQLIERKQGLFRMKMMGKRVNFAARSVISPDPSIDTNEIGVPVPFAMTLTFPEPVTSVNVEYLRELVIRGANEYPGANFVIESNGRKRALANLNLEQREAIANSLAPPTPGVKQEQQVVYRHAKDGDSVLMNRQPTLHKPSIMSMRMKVLSGQKTIRMHYANCNTFNADFDGDEMNMHLPQDQIARTEARLIMNADSQYVVPKDGSPLRGLIQDHCAGGAFLTSRGTFLTREEYEQLVFVGLQRFVDENAKVVHQGVANTLTKVVMKSGAKRVAIETPAIIKPKEFFTGKQVITTVIKTITNTVAAKMFQGIPFKGIQYEGKSRVPGDAWGASLDGEKDEAMVLVVDGELLRGVLDKNQFGATSNGLVHIIHELLGPDASGKVLGSFGRVFSEYLRMRGFTCSPSDLFLDEEGENTRREIIRSIHLCSARNLAHFAAHFCPTNMEKGEAKDVPMLEDRRDRSSLPAHMQTLSAKDLAQRGPILDGRVAECVGKVFAAGEQSQEAYVKLLDSLYKSTVSKRSSAGSDLAAGKRLIKPFPDNGFAAMVTTGAKGSKVNFGMICSFLAQQELEGKRVPMMASGKTLPSFAAYDLSARPGGFIADRYLSGLRPQEFFFHCMSGREGLVDTAVKTARSGYLQRCLVKGMEGFSVQYDGSVRDSDGLVVQFLYGEDGIDVCKAPFLSSFDEIVRNVSTVTARHFRSVKSQDILGSIAEVQAVEAGEKPKPELAVMYPTRKKNEERDPVTSMYTPPRVPGAVSEKFLGKIKKYIEEEKLEVTPEEDPVDNDGRAIQGKSKKMKKAAEKTPFKLSAEAFELLARLRFRSSLVEAGESVGCLAAQSIGEPSTQMTLNTFHLAGHGAANVTLGIPRLRELLQTASNNMKTPMTTLAIHEGVGASENAQFICKSLRRVTLLELLDDLRVHTRRVKYLSTEEEFFEYEIEVKVAELDMICKSVPTLTSERLGEFMRTAFANKCLSRLYQMLFRVASRAESLGARADVGDIDDVEVEASSGQLTSASLKGVHMNKLIAGFRYQGSQRHIKEVDSDEEKNVKAIQDKAGHVTDNTRAGSDSSMEESSDEDMSQDVDSFTRKQGKSKGDLFDNDEDTDDDMSDNERRKKQKKSKATDDAAGAGSDEERDDESEQEFSDEEKQDDAQNDEDDEDDDDDNGDDEGARRKKQSKQKKTRKSTANAVSTKEVNLKSKAGRFLRSMKWDVKTRTFTLVMAHVKDRLVAKPVYVANAIRKIAADLAVQEVDGISSPQLLTHTDRKKSATGSLSEIRCAGSNFNAIASLDPSIVNHNKIRTNDVYTFSHVYGIEAARNVFVSEMSNVFGHYGITVDFRHLSLIGDVMTRGGKFRPFNRQGMSSHSSPFLQMSFETSTKFLADCSLRAAVDDLKTPAGAIVTGKTARLGTGAFDVLSAVKKMNVGSSNGKGEVKVISAINVETKKEEKSRSRFNFSTVTKFDY